MQDDFRISGNFILNIGMRYDYMAVPNERDDRLFNRGGPFRVRSAAARGESVRGGLY